MRCKLHVVPQLCLWAICSAAVVRVHNMKTNEKRRIFVGVQAMAADATISQVLTSALSSPHSLQVLDCDRGTAVTSFKQLFALPLVCVEPPQPPYMDRAEPPRLPGMDGTAQQDTTTLPQVEHSVARLSQTVCSEWNRIAAMRDTTDTNSLGSHLAALRALYLSCTALKQASPGATPCMDNPTCILGHPALKANGQQDLLAPIEGAPAPEITQGVLALRQNEIEPFTTQDRLLELHSMNSSWLASFMGKYPSYLVPPSKLPQLAAYFASRSVAGRRWNSCAVVGNGQKLRESLLGSVIDSHDAVFRFNLAVTGSRDVGSRITHRLVTRHAWNDHFGAAGEVLVQIPDDMESLQAYMRLAQRAAENKQSAPFHLSPSFVQLVSKLLQPCIEAQNNDSIAYPSTGLHGVFAAIALCGGTINAFGFGGPVVGQGQHYARELDAVMNEMCSNVTEGNRLGEQYRIFQCSEKGKPVASRNLYNGNTWHDYRCERALLSELRKLGIVTFW